MINHPKREITKSVTLECWFDITKILRDGIFFMLWLSK